MQLREQSHRPDASRRVVLSGIIAISLVLAVAGGAAGAAPANDAFAAATVLGEGGNLWVDSSAATKEPTEPNHAGDRGGASIWFSWTAPYSGVVTFATANTDVDTLLAVYTGAAVGSLTRVAANDDIAFFEGPSRVCFAALSGTTYHVALDGFAGDAGQVMLEWTRYTDPGACPGEPPHVTGTTSVGSTLSSDTGTWISAGGLARQWLRCVAGFCSPIPNATGPEYTLVPRDAGTTIRIDVGAPGAVNTSDPTATVAMAPSPRPNGRIFYTSNTNLATANYEIFSMFADGSHRRQLTNRAGYDTEPAPSPDGTWLAFVQSTPDFTLATMNADGTGVTSLGVAGAFPVVSPDGSRIAYIRSDGVGIVDRDGTHNRLIATGSVYDVDWSPDATKLAFAVRPPGETDADIAVVAADGGSEPQLVVASPLDDHSPAWSADGTKIAFVRGPISGAITDGDTFVADADGSGEVLVDDGDALRVNSYVDWSPDGTKLLVSRSPNNRELWTMNPDGTEKIQLATGGPAEMARWGALASFPLLISLSGSGSVGSAPLGISCTAFCSPSFTDSTLVTLTATPASGFVFSGWNGVCSGAAACTVTMDAPYELRAVFTSAVPSGGGTGGGGGGGGGGGPVNMNVKLSANKTIVNPGDVVDVVAVVGNKGSAGTSKAIVKITLPAGLVLAGPPASERGGGCSGSTTIVCDLDFFPGDFTTPVRFAVRTSANGAQEITAEVTPQGDDADRSDNKATLVLQVGATAPTTTTTTPTTPVPKPTPGTSRTTGTARADTLVGTPKADTLRGLGGNDTLRGGGGNDVLDGGRGRDRLDGGPGNDLIRARDGERDVITCGQGRDRVLADRRDSVARDCEHVSRG